jgi:hypothetical protein
MPLILVGSPILTSNNMNLADSLSESDTPATLRTPNSAHTLPKPVKEPRKDHSFAQT